MLHLNNSYLKSFRFYKTLNDAVIFQNDLNNLYSWYDYSTFHSNVSNYKVPNVFLKKKKGLHIFIIIT